MPCIIPPRGGTATLHTNTYSSERLVPPRSKIPPLSSLTTQRIAHARPLHPAALAFVPSGIVLVRVRAWGECTCAHSKDFRTDPKKRWAQDEEPVPEWGEFWQDPVAEPFQCKSSQVKSRFTPRWVQVPVHGTVTERVRLKSRSQTAPFRGWVTLWRCFLMCVSSSFCRAAWDECTCASARKSYYSLGLFVKKDLILRSPR